MRKINSVHVILLAGGVGSRFCSDIPKQFVKVDDIPIIIYTLKKLQLDEIKGITVVCVDGWISYLKELIEKYEIKKVNRIVSGGASAFESIRKGYDVLLPDLSVDDIIIIHDSVRPLLPKPVIDDCINVAAKNGNACACLKSIEGLVLRDNDECGVEPADRYRVMRIQTPQAYRVDFFNSLIEKADAEGKNDFPYADGMCLYYKQPIYFAKSFTANTKITTRPDIAFMKAMMMFSDEELMGENI